MVLSGHRSELDVKISFNVGSFSYLVYVTSNVSIKCFRCGKVGHQRQECTNDRSGNAGQAKQGTAQGEAAAAADSAGCTSEATTSKSNTDSPVISPTTDSHTGETPATMPNETESPVIETLITGPNVPTPSTTEPSEADSSAPEVPVPPAEQSPETPVETGLKADGAGVEEANRSKPVDQPESAEVVSGPISGDSDTGLYSEPMPENAQPLDEMINKAITEMETEFKKPTYKRKSKNKENNPVKVKKGERGTEGLSEAEGYSSDSSWSGCSQTDVSTVVYTAEQLMNFLLKTKGQRDVRVVDYFPDKQQFVRDGTFWMREGEIPKPEYYRLRQKLREVRKGLRNGNVAS